MSGPGAAGLRVPLGAEVAVAIGLLVATAFSGPSLSLAATAPAWNALGCGVLAAVVAWVRLFSPHGAPRAGVVTIVLGAWLITAALVVGRPAAHRPEVAAMTELVAGVALTVLSVVSVALAYRSRR